MENINEFYRRIDKILEDSKKDLYMTDETIAFILVNKSFDYYYRSLAKCAVCKFRTDYAKEV